MILRLASHLERDMLIRLPNGENYRVDTNPERIGDVVSFCMSRNAGTGLRVDMRLYPDDYVEIIA